MACCKMFVLLLALLWPVSLAKVAVNDFFPFGVSNGDTVMIRSDDGSSPSIPISIGFPFFDYLHDSLWVNVNGAISFLTTISTFTPVCTPVQQNFRMIAPYWCDIDISRTGDIFYRESFDASVLGKATDEVSSAFPDSRHIRLRWAFIITWFNVTFFPDTFDQRPRNTFQAVLTTDGTQSFAIFYYNNMTWTTGQATSSGGNSSGLGGIPAKAGFDAGDGQTLFMIPGSCTSDIVTIGDRSNVGSPGKWLFRVDNSNVQSAGCSNNFTGNVRVSPSFVNAYGHVPIEITGPCVQAAENATCRFYDPSGNVTDAPAVIMGNQTSMKFGCSTPFFYTIGRLRLDLIISINDTQQQLFTGFLYITMPSDSDAGLQVSVQPSPNRTDYYRMTFNWNPADFGISSRIDCEKIELIQIKTLRDWNEAEPYFEIEVMIVQPELAPVIIFDMAKDILLDEFGCGTLQNAEFMINFAIQRVECEAGKNRSPQFLTYTAWTEVAKLIGDLCSPFARGLLCAGWHLLDQGPPQGLPPCPRTAEEADADSRFTRDVSCANSPSSCFFTPNVDHCVSDGNQQCGYKDGKIQLQGGGHGSMYSSTSFAGLPHKINDMIPWVLCCYKQSESLCQLYEEKRPSDPTTNYTAPRPAAASGDPHITTFDLLGYTFNGAGEFWMLRNSSVQPVLLQARMEKYSDGGVEKLATIFTAFVMKDQSSPTIQVQKSTIRTVDVLVDGEALDLSIPSFRRLQLDGAQVAVTDDLSVVSVTFPNGMTFQITTISGAFALSAICSEEYKGNKTHGLLGVYDGDDSNDLQTPDGTIVPKNSSLEFIHYNFGMKWIISESDSLFNYGSKQYWDYYFPDFRPNFDFDTSQASPAAVQLCGAQSDCLYDFMTTGNAAIANQTKAFAAQFNDTVNLFSQNVSLCPALNKPTNGYFQVPNYFPRSVAVFSCFDGYEITGNNILICADNYQWNGTAPVCTAVSTVSTVTAGITTPPSASSAITGSQTAITSASITSASITSASITSASITSASITPTTTVTQTTTTPASIPSATTQTTTNPGTGNPSTTSSSTVTSQSANTTQAINSTSTTSTTGRSTSSPDGASTLHSTFHHICICFILVMTKVFYF